MYVRNFPESERGPVRINIPKNYGGVYFSKNTPKPPDIETTTKVHTPEQSPLHAKSPLMQRERITPLSENITKNDKAEKVHLSVMEADEYPNECPYANNSEHPTDEVPKRSTGELPINPEDLLIASVITALLREGKGDLLPLELALLLIS